MNSVYDLPDGRKSVIYTEGNRIMLHAFPARRGTSLFALKDDYLSYLFMESFILLISIFKGRLFLMELEKEKKRFLPAKAGWMKWKCSHGLI